MKNFGHTILLLIALSTVCVVGGAYVYMLTTTNAALTNSAGLRDQIASAEANKTREQTFMQLYQGTAAQWSVLPNYFVPADNVLAFIEAVEAIGTEVGATTTISSISADQLDKAPAGTLGNVSVHIDSQASWPTAMRILELSELLPYKVNVDNVSLTAQFAPSKSAKHTWKLSFDLAAKEIVESSSTASSTQTL
ncbi:MAG: hypothetical protein KGI59_01115 [Patescibacteria group bacterium]|nr:hypothetical protein [Patescibacteria group bacterium]